MNNDHISLDTLVELLDQYSDVYPFSPTGARGWVRARRELPKHDPEVYIEWDKHHWRYHGEKDGWTYQHHFRAVDDTLPDIGPAEALPDVNQLVADAHRQIDVERCPHCGDFHNVQTEFLDTLVQAQDAALGSDGYFIISLTPREADGATVYEPVIHTAALSATAKQMIETQLVHIAAQLYEGHIVDLMNEIKGGHEPTR